MSKKFQSKSGLPEQIGSDAYAETRGQFSRTHKPKPMCNIRGCMTRRTRYETLPNGEKEWLYAQGYGEVVIRTDDGKEWGHVCQKHYAEIILQAGKDQLSCAAKAEDRQTQNYLSLRTSAPRGLVDHLTNIQSQLQHAQDVENDERWAHEREHFERMQEQDEEFARRWEEEHGD